MNTPRGFTLVELLVVISIVGMMASVVLASMADIQRDAKDKRRQADIEQLHNALQAYETDHGYFPKESAGANGDVDVNLKNFLVPQYMSAMPTDPTGLGNATYYYYYDGRAQCGAGKYYAVVFAREMDKASNSNYNDYLNTTCTGTVDGEGRGGGTNSFNRRIGESGG